MFKITEGNKDFYPTPPELADELLAGISYGYRGVVSILEPSAGKGDLVEAVKAKTKYEYYDMDIDCIEKDVNLQYILKGKGMRVIHDDFLTFNTEKAYDLILMNAPFSEGAKHLLKAISIQENHGGLIRCILNAETLRNLCNRERQELYEKLSEYNADISYEVGAFVKAERSSDVEIAIIKVDIPKAEYDSVIFEKLRKENIDYGSYENKNWLTEADFIDAIVSRYKYEIKAGVSIIREMAELSPFLMNTLDKSDQFSEPVLAVTVNETPCATYHETVRAYTKAIRLKYWRALFDSKEFSRIMTSDMRSSYIRRLAELADYEFSSFNIYQIKIELNASIVKGIEDSILKMFDELSHKHSWYDETSKNVHYYNGWKSNRAHKIMPKVILPMHGVWCSIFKKFRFYDCGILADLERALNMLDGNPKREITVPDALRYAENTQDVKNIQCRHFTLTFFKKGTCHIKFTNLELLEKLNIYGSQKKGWLPPSYGKVHYNEMDLEERAVVNEFQGQIAYEEIISNADYYLDKPEQKALTA